MGWIHGDAAHHLLALTVAILLFLHGLLRPAAAKTFPGDAEALRQLKEAVDPSSVPPGSCINSWVFSTADPCDALYSANQFTCGFRCDAVDPAGLARVTDISLDSAGYSGSLSPAVWIMPFLQTLEAPDNRFFGPIPPPPPPADLRQLRRVTLSGNAFSGGIPVANFPSLEELYLDGNLLSGPMPVPMTSFPSLRHLEVQRNNLSGAFPDLSAMAALTYFDASDNNLSGRMPSGPALPRSLVELSARNNALEGPLPADLATGLPSLQVLDLSHNRLGGRVPSSLFAHQALQQLTLSYNQFTSLESSPPLWGWWRRMVATGNSGLVAVDLGHNHLAGTLPLGWVRAMPKLTALSLEENLFTGMIPTEYAVRVAGARAGAGADGATPLARLMLAGNYLYGPIPSPLTGVKEGEATVSLADNCLFRCPDAFFFCQGADQKQPSTCRDFNPVIP
ncbi:hypothetical protein Taro_039720 [Colocasia esculenta]|uniref:Uncharacterized protein n=1 Tax=Colocasia esculenta TaxID=4460 RepID=A0A843WHA7_COLES|nr:hypothetical protein [Colocasia esculenta]